MQFIAKVTQARKIKSETNKNIKPIEPKRKDMNVLLLFINLYLNKYKNVNATRNKMNE